MRFLVGTLTISVRLDCSVMVYSEYFEGDQLRISLGYTAILRNVWTLRRLLKQLCQGIFRPSYNALHTLMTSRFKVACINSLEGLLTLLQYN